LLLIPIVSFGQSKTENWPPEIKSDQNYTYKQIEDINLNLWVFNPPNHNPNSPKPAIVFFFGGGFRKGSPEQFVKHCEYLSARGMVSIVADYRVSSRHNVSPIHCLKDAKSAIRWGETLVSYSSQSIKHLFLSKYKFHLNYFHLHQSKLLYQSWFHHYQLDYFFEQELHQV